MINQNSIVTRQTATIQPWAPVIYDLLKAHAITLVSYVPDAGHSQLITLCQADASVQIVSLTTEEEGVALAAGAYLGGRRAVLLMQSSGVGNCINMLSLVKTCNFPFLTLITMRGEFGEFNGWQVPMGQAAAVTLNAIGIIVQRVEQLDEVHTVVDAAARLAFDSYCGVAVLLAQRLIGAKRFVEGK